MFICVEQPQIVVFLPAALAAVDSSHEVYVVEDACAGSSDDSYRNAINLIGEFYRNVRIITEV